MGQVRRFFALLVFAVASVVVVAAPAGSPPSPTPDILVSRQLMQHGQLTIGEVVTLATDAEGKHAARFRVAGVYEPTPDPARFTVERLEARMHLPDLITLTADDDPASTEAITAINIRLADRADTDAFVRDLLGRSLGVSASSTLRQGPAAFQVLQQFHLAIAAVTVIGSTAFLLALMVIRAEERRETVGLLRLIGISQRSILLEVIAEGIAVAFVGAAFGLALAMATEHGINRFFQARYDTPLIFLRITPWIAARSVMIALPVGMFAGAVASWTLLKRSASELVRR